MVEAFTKFPLSSLWEEGWAHRCFVKNRKSRMIFHPLSSQQLCLYTLFSWSGSQVKCPDVYEQKCGYKIEGQPWPCGTVGWTVFPYTKWWLVWFPGQDTYWVGFDPWQSTYRRQPVNVSLSAFISLKSVKIYFWMRIKKKFIECFNLMEWEGDSAGCLLKNITYFKDFERRKSNGKEIDICFMWFQRTMTRLMYTS